MNETSGGAAYAGMPPVRRLGRTLRRHRRLRVGLIQLAYVTLAFRVLADIALRALSPAVNDPPTAVQVLDSEESLLRMLVGRDLDVGEITGPRGNTRVSLALPDWSDYVALAVDEIVEAGAGRTRIRQRVERLLRDLSAVAPASR